MRLGRLRRQGGLGCRGSPLVPSDLRMVAACRRAKGVLRCLDVWFKGRCGSSDPTTMQKAAAAPWRCLRVTLHLRPLCFTYVSNFSLTHKAAVA